MLYLAWATLMLFLTEEILLEIFLEHPIPQGGSFQFRPPRRLWDSQGLPA